MGGAAEAEAAVGVRAVGGPAARPVGRGTDTGAGRGGRTRGLTVAGGGRGTGTVWWQGSAAHAMNRQIARWR